MRQRETEVVVGRESRDGRRRRANGEGGGCRRPMKVGVKKSKAS